MEINKSLLYILNLQLQYSKMKYELPNKYKYIMRNFEILIVFLNLKKYFIKILNILKNDFIKI